MKHKLLLAIVLVMAVVQCWASPFDSSRTGNLDTNSNSTRRDFIVSDSLKPFIIEPYITVNPKSLDFGTVALGRKVSKTFKVRGFGLKGNLTLQVLSTRSSSSDGFSINVTTITPAQAMRGVTVRVTYEPTYVGTQNSTSVYISGGGIETQTVALRGTCTSSIEPIGSSITVNPSSLDFGTVNLGESVTKTFTVRGIRLSGSLSLEVLTSRSGSSDEFTISRTTISRAQALFGVEVKVTYTPQAVGTNNSTIVRVSGGGAESQDVTLSGTCVISPTLDSIPPTIIVKPQSLDFGTVQLGQSVTKSIVVRGLRLNGPLTLNVLTSRANSTSDGFTISRTTITPEQALLGATVNVTYRPLYVGTQNTTAIYISGGGAESVVVPLTGTCIERITIPPLFAGDDPDANMAAPEAGDISTTGVNQWSQNVNIVAQGQDIIIDSPIDQSATICDINGHARSVSLKAGRNVIPTRATGVHIVRVGNATAKLFIK